MTNEEKQREQEIIEKSKTFADALSDGLYYNSQQHKCREHGFVQGAKWADAHPPKGMVRVEDVSDWIEQHFDEYIGRSEYMASDFRKAMECQTTNKH